MTKNQKYITHFLENNYNTLKVYFIFFCSIIFGIYSFYYGLMTTSDSIQYLTTSINIFHSFKLISVRGEFYSAFPPLYPFLLSFLPILKEHFLIGISFLHSLIFLFNSYLIMRLFDHYIENFVIRFMCLILCLISIPFIINHVFIWSESFFYTLTLFWSFILLTKEYKGVFTSWALLTIITLLICLQRKTGFIFIITSSLFLIYDNKFDKKIISKPFIYSLISIIFPIYWRIRYRTLNEDLLYIKNFSIIQTWHAIQQEITELGSWIIPELSPEILKWIVFLLFLFFIIRQSKKIYYKRELILSILLFSIYSISIITVMTFFKLSQTIDIRVLGSIFPFIILIIGICTSNYLNKSNFKYRFNTIIVLFCFILSYNLVRTYHNLKNWGVIEKISYPELIKMAQYESIN